jgi:hypothetical protein
MNASAIRLAFLTFPLAFLPAEPPAPAVPPPPSTTTAPEPAPSPQPIALPTMARSLETGLSRVRFLQRTVGPSSVSTNIGRSLATTGTRLTEMEASLRAAGPDEVSYRQLDRMRVDWMAFDESLAHWESSLEAEATAVDAARTELKSLDETWKATLADKSGEQVQRCSSRRSTTLEDRSAAGSAARARGGAALVGRGIVRSPASATRSAVDHALRESESGSSPSRTIRSGRRHANVLPVP